MATPNPLNRTPHGPYDPNNTGTCQGTVVTFQPQNVDADGNAIGKLDSIDVETLCQVLRSFIMPKTSSDGNKNNNSNTSSTNGKEEKFSSLLKVEVLQV